MSESSPRGREIGCGKKCLGFVDLGSVRGPMSENKPRGEESPGGDKCSDGVHSPPPTAWPNVERGLHQTTVTNLFPLLPFRREISSSALCMEQDERLSSTPSPKIINNPSRAHNRSQVDGVRNDACKSWLAVVLVTIFAMAATWAASPWWAAASVASNQVDGVHLSLHSSLHLGAGVGRTGYGTGTGGLGKCEQHLRTNRAVTTTCAAFEDVGKNGAVDMPIQFENGQDPPTVVFAPFRRIVAIGDLHGDFERTQGALQLAGVLSTDGQHRWIGGTTVVVQVGDVLDRGEDEIAILSLLAWLGKEARSKGGAVFQILGNHETMNVAGDFRYVAPGGFQEAEAFAEYCEHEHGGNWDTAFEGWHEASQELKTNRGVGFASWLPIFNPIKMQKGIAARVKLLSPGGPLAMQLAAHGVVLKVNDWLFAHGGVLPHHVDYGLERMNHEVSMWLKMGNNRWGKPAEMPFVAVKGFDSIVWSRLYSRENFSRPQEKIQACGILAAALSATNSRGLIVGHTPQTVGANSKCDGRIWRIDVGMSSGVLHALPEVLEIVDDKVRILTGAGEFLQEEEMVSEESSWKDKMEVQNFRI